jgi:hypothetical protein
MLDHVSAEFRPSRGLARVTPVASVLMLGLELIFVASFWSRLSVLNR